MELEFVDWLRQNIPPHPLLRLGPGDDAAILQTAGRLDSVVTADMLADGVHFHLSSDTPERIGHKALAVNLSDLAAMAAIPRSCVVSMFLPRAGAGELGRQLFRGIVDLAVDFDVAIAGGDTNCWDGPLTIGITAIGELSKHGPWERKGAKVGDVMVVTGELGGSILGKHLDVCPRVREALHLNQRFDVHAAIDISDGLSLDAWRLAEASELGVELDLNCVPISDAAVALAQQDGKTAVQHAISDGEDFELLLAVPPDQIEVLLQDDSLEISCTAVGRCIARPGLWYRDEEGSCHISTPGGYRHD